MIYRDFLLEILGVQCTSCMHFLQNLGAPRIVAAFEISPRSFNPQCTKRRPRNLAACSKWSSLLLTLNVRILTLILNNAQCARSPYAYSPASTIKVV